MKQQTFYSPQGRGILIKIDNDYICFYHTDSMMQDEWYQHQLEIGNNLDEKAKDVDDFYNIPSIEWVLDRTNRLDRGDNWHSHMKEKIWFTNDMYDFIEKNAQKQTT